MTSNTREGLFTVFNTNGRPEINELQAEALDDVRQVARCRIDLETWRSHQAVLSKVEEIIDAEGDERHAQALGRELVVLEQIAANKCLPCLGKTACAEFGLGFVRLDRGVTGGLGSKKRKKVAFEQKIPQPPRRSVTAGAAGRPRNS